MQVHYSLSELPSFSKAVITTGSFDGVHKGHVQLAQQIKQLATSIGGESVLITFNPHPRHVVALSAPPLYLLNTLTEKTGRLEAIGIDHLVVVSFTKAFSEQSAETYVEDFLIKYFNPHTIVIGYNHKFGKNRVGDIDLLNKLAGQYGFQTHVVEKQLMDSIGVSSTKIREAIAEGDMRKATALLDYPYTLSGEVVHGDGRGKTIGYPTANIKVDETQQKLLPSLGAYAVQVHTVAGQFSGMLNIGFKPTFYGETKAVEVHLFDFSNDLYGQEISIQFIDFLRPEQKFNSKEELVQQLQADEEKSRLLV